MIPKLILQQMQILLIILHFVLIDMLVFTSGVPDLSKATFTTNYKYSFVGKSIIDISTNIASSNSTDWSSSPILATVIYPQSLDNSNLRFALTFDDFSATNVLQGLSVDLKINSISQTQMIIKVSSKNAANIVKITVGYLIICVNFEYDLNFMIVAYSQTFQFGKPISNNQTSFHQQTLSLPSAFNSSNSNVLGFLSGIDAVFVGESSTMGINCNASILDSSSLSVLIWSATQDPTVLYSLSYTFILYNQQGLNSLPDNHFLFFGNIIQISQTFKINSQLTEFNTFVGLLSFGTSSLDHLFFSFSIGQFNTINLKLSSSFDYNIVSYLIIYSKFCNYQTPYLSSDSQCLEKCPDSTIAIQGLVCIRFANLVANPLSSDEEKVRLPTAVAVAIATGLTIIVVILGLIISKCCAQHNSQESDQSKNSQQRSIQSSFQQNIQKKKPFEFQQNLSNKELRLNQAEIIRQHLQQIIDSCLLKFMKNHQLDQIMASTQHQFCPKVSQHEDQMSKISQINDSQSYPSPYFLQVDIQEGIGQNVKADSIEPWQLNILPGMPMSGMSNFQSDSGFTVIDKTKQSHYIDLEEERQHPDQPFVEAQIPGTQDALSTIGQVEKNEQKIVSFQMEMTVNEESTVQNPKDAANSDQGI